MILTGIKNQKNKRDKFFTLYDIDTYFPGPGVRAAITLPEPLYSYAECTRYYELLILGLSSFSHKKKIPQLPTAFRVVY